MAGLSSRQFVTHLFLALALSHHACSFLNADEAINFDAPALVCAKPLVVDPAADPFQPAGEMIVEVVIPVSTQIRSSDRNMIQEFRFDVFWNRSAYPVFDYGPKTQTVSSIEGTIAVEKRSDRNRSLGFQLSSGYEDIVKGSANAQLSNKSGSTIRYQEVPQHDILVASGTVKRGTGAFLDSTLPKEKPWRAVATWSSHFESPTTGGEVFFKSNAVQKAKRNFSDRGKKTSVSDGPSSCRSISKATTRRE